MAIRSRCPQYNAIQCICTCIGSTAIQPILVRTWSCLAKKTVRVHRKSCRSFVGRRIEVCNLTIPIGWLLEIGVAETGIDRQSRQDLPIILNICLELGLLNIRLQYCRSLRKAAIGNSIQKEGEGLLKVSRCTHTHRSRLWV